MEKKYITAEEIESVKCQKDEQETALSWYRDDEYVRMSVTDNTMLTRMKKLVSKYPKDFKCYVNCYDPDTGKPASYFFEFPVNCIGFRAHRELSEEQREVFRNRMKKLWENNPNLLSQDTDEDELDEIVDED